MGFQDPNTELWMVSTVLAGEKSVTASAANPCGNSLSKCASYSVLNHTYYSNSQHTVLASQQYASIDDSKYNDQSISDQQDFCNLKSHLPIPAKQK